MKSLMLALLILIFSVNSASGMNVKYLQKDKPAPFTGYLITPEQEKYFRQTFEDKLILEQKVNKQAELLITYDKKIETYERINDNLKHNLQAKEVNNALDKILYVALGLVLGFGAGVLYNGR